MVPFRKLLLLMLLLNQEVTSNEAGARKVEAPNTEKSALERGRYIVEAVAICFECHSERDFTKPGSPITPGMKGSGRILYGQRTRHQLTAPNITPDPETGIGKWTDQQVIRAIRDGLSIDNRRLNTEMPYIYYRALSEDDLGAVVQYLRTIDPVNHSLPKNKANIVTEERRPAMEDIHSVAWPEQVLRGEFLVRIASCETCHTPKRDGVFIPRLNFGGGIIIRGVASTNITFDTSGISYYGFDQFASVMRTGRIGARPINPAMPWFFYKEMTTEDLAAMFAYLQAIPHVVH